MVLLGVALPPRDRGACVAPPQRAVRTGSAAGGGGGGGADPLLDKLGTYVGHRGEGGVTVHEKGRPDGEMGRGQALCGGRGGSPKRMNRWREARGSSAMAAAAAPVPMGGAAHSPVPRVMRSAVRRFRWWEYSLVKSHRGALPRGELGTPEREYAQEGSMSQRGALHAPRARLVVTSMSRAGFVLSRDRSDA